MPPLAAVGTAAAASATGVVSVRQAGLDVLAECIIRNHGGVRVVMGYGVRPRPDQRHLAVKYVEQLRKFIQAVPPKNSARPS